MGVAGVAIGTITSQLISCVLGTEVSVPVGWQYISYTFLQSLRINEVPIMDPDTSRWEFRRVSRVRSSTLSNALLQSSVNSFGAIAMAGYTAANNMLGFLYMYQ